MILRTLPAADEDADEIEGRLESEQPGYGVAFTELLNTGFEKISGTPRLYSRTEDGPLAIETREYYITRFEYRLIYVVLENELVVLALVHARKRPGSWVKRLLDLRKDFP